jgi:hypothetical protein
MHRFLKQEGTRKGTLAGTGGQKGGMLGESTGPVDNIPRDTPLGGSLLSSSFCFFFFANFASINHQQTPQILKQILVDMLESTSVFTHVQHSKANRFPFAA